MDSMNVCQFDWRSHALATDTASSQDENIATTCSALDLEYKPFSMNRQSRIVVVVVAVLLAAVVLFATSGSQFAATPREAESARTTQFVAKVVTAIQDAYTCSAGANDQRHTVSINRTCQGASGYKRT